MRRDHVDAVSIGANTENFTHRVLLGRLAREYRLPAICWFSDSVEAGALMAYAHDVKAGARRVGAQIVEILNGGNPAEIIPRERPIAIVDSRHQPSPWAI